MNMTRMARISYEVSNKTQKERLILFLLTFVLTIAFITVGGYLVLKNIKPDFIYIKNDMFVLGMFFKNIQVIFFSIIIVFSLLPEVIDYLRIIKPKLRFLDGFAFILYSIAILFTIYIILASMEDSVKMFLEYVAQQGLIKEDQVDLLNNDLSTYPNKIKSSINGFLFLDLVFIIMICGLLFCAPAHQNGFFAVCIVSVIFLYNISPSYIIQHIYLFIFWGAFFFFLFYALAYYMEKLSMGTNEIL